ncbi:FMN-dependent NADH-azoreductase [Sunxiuqinia sp. A32]|uniref:FMN-dependent NADH-azoreductase n=1 Tax=Sunxiuqinia sp. A32 TaxID=3461496 RepID=UPI0040465914
MKNILHIISGLNEDSSFSVKLGNALIEKLKETYPGSEVIVRNLAKEQLPHLQKENLIAFSTPTDNQTKEQFEAVNKSEEAIQQLLDADIIVIGAPMYNFGISSALKAWIDHIARVGVTFRYTENGPEGMVKDKKVYIAMATGGFYSQGEMQSYDFVSPYLKTVLGFLGMTDVEVVLAEGTSINDTKEQAVKKALDVVSV